MFVEQSTGKGPLSGGLSQYCVFDRVEFRPPNSFFVFNLIRNCGSLCRRKGTAIFAISDLKVARERLFS